MSVSNDPDEIRADIERTRATLSDDVDDLAESVKPKNVAGHQTVNGACLVCTGLSGAPVNRKLMLSVQRLEVWGTL